MKRYAAFFFWATALALLLGAVPAIGQSFSSIPGTTSPTFAVNGPRGPYLQADGGALEVHAPDGGLGIARGADPVGANDFVTLQSVPPLPGALTTTDWYVDAAVGNDANAGTSSGSPLKTGGEIVRRWGSGRPNLQQPTTIHVLAGGMTDPVAIIPTGAGSLTISCAMATAWTGTVSGVVAKSRSANQLLTVNAVSGMAPYQLVFNSTRSTYAHVYGTPSGTAKISQTLTASTPPSTGGTELDNWANGDTLVGETLATADVRALGYTPTATGNVSAIYHCTVPNTLYLADYGNVIESNVIGSASAAAQQTGIAASSNGFVNVAFETVLTSSEASVYNTLSVGGMTPTGISGGIVQWMLGGAAFLNDPILGTTGISRHNISGFVSGGLYLDSQPTFTFGNFQLFSPVWGTAKLFIGNASPPGSFLALQGTAATLLLTSGGISLGSSSIGYGWDPSSATYDTGVTLTPANIDAEFSLGRTGVCSPQGSTCIVNGSAPSAVATGGLARLPATATGMNGEVLSVVSGLPAWATLPSAPSVAGSGLWYSASGSLDSAAIALGGDLTPGTFASGVWPYTVTSLIGSALPGTCNGFLSQTAGTWACTGAPGMTQLTGRGTAGPGSGSQAFALAATGITAGPCGDASHVGVATWSTDGTASACTATSIAAPASGLTGIVAPAQGGYGVASPPAHNLVVTEGASPADAIALGAGQILVGQSSADPAPETMSGDATLSSAGVCTLATSGVSAGTYPTSPGDILQAVIDAKGRVTNAAQVAISVGNSNLAAGAYPNITGVGALTSGSLGAGVAINYTAVTGTGLVPNANQDCQAISGDVLGTTCASTVQSAAAGIQVGAASHSFGGGAGGIVGVTNATTVPSSACTGGSCLYSHAGAVSTNGGGFEVDDTAGGVVGNFAPNPSHASTSSCVALDSAGGSVCSDGTNLQINARSTAGTIDLQFGATSDLRINSTSGTTTVSNPAGGPLLFKGGSTFGPSGLLIDTDLIEGANPGGGNETLVYIVDGTVNTQLAVIERRVKYGTITAPSSAGGFLQETALPSLASGHSAIVHTFATCRCVTAGSGGPAINDRMDCDNRQSYVNTGSAIDGSLNTVVSLNKSASLGTSTSCAGVGNAFIPQISLAAASGDLGIWDCSLYTETTYN